MHREIHIEVKPEFEFGEMSTRFYKTCVRWAEQLDAIIGGGVSVWFFVESQPHPDPHRISATICWRGKELGRFFLANRVSLIIHWTTYAADPGEVVTPKNVWEDFLKPSWMAILEEDVREASDRLNKLRDVGSPEWGRIKYA